jgi:hypothetical protein
MGRGMQYNAPLEETWNGNIMMMRHFAKEKKEIGGYSMEVRLQKALWRNLNELRFAISMRNCYNELARCAPKTNWAFFSYCSIALFNDMFSHEMKVLDMHKDAASFWYIRNCEPELVNSQLEKHCVKLGDIETLAKELKHIRDKTHGHIDKNGVMDSRKVWEDAHIKGDLVNEIIDKLWQVLNEVYKEEVGSEFGQPIHDGDDVDAILTACRAAAIKI